MPEERIGTPAASPANSVSATPVASNVVTAAPADASVIKDIPNNPLLQGDGRSTVMTSGSSLYSSVINGKTQVVNKTKIDIRTTAKIPFTSASDLIDQSDRGTPVITDTPGRGTFLIYDAKTNKQVTKKAEMLIQSMSWQRREANSIIKNIKGITFQALDSYPLILGIQGNLVNSRDDEALARRNSNDSGQITHTHWFIQFLRDYEEFSASNAIQNNYKVLFSVEDFTAQVHILDQNATLTAQYPNLGSFSMTLLVIQQNYRGAIDLAQTKAKNELNDIQAFANEQPLDKSFVDDKFTQDNYLLICTDQKVEKDPLPTFLSGISLPKGVPF